MVFYARLMAFFITIIVVSFPLPVAGMLSSDAGILSVVTWNLENNLMYLGSRGVACDTHQKWKLEERVPYICDILQGLKADIYLLQELRSSCNCNHAQAGDGKEIEKSFNPEKNLSEFFNKHNYKQVSQKYYNKDKSMMYMVAYNADRFEMGFEMEGEEKKETECLEIDDWNGGDGKSNVDKGEGGASNDHTRSILVVRLVDKKSTRKLIVVNVHLGHDVSQVTKFLNVFQKYLNSVIDKNDKNGIKIPIIAAGDFNNSFPKMPEGMSDITKELKLVLVKKLDGLGDRRSLGQFIKRLEENKKIEPFTQIRYPYAIFPRHESREKEIKEQCEIKIEYDKEMEKIFGGEFEFMEYEKKREKKKEWLAKKFKNTGDPRTGKLDHVFCFEMKPSIGPLACFFPLINIDNKIDKKDDSSTRTRRALKKLLNIKALQNLLHNSDELRQFCSKKRSTGVVPALAEAAALTDNLMSMMLRGDDADNNRLRGVQETVNLRLMPAEMAQKRRECMDSLGSLGSQGSQDSQVDLEEDCPEDNSLEYEVSNSLDEYEDEEDEGLGSFGEKDRFISLINNLTDSEVTEFFELILQEALNHKSGEAIQETIVNLLEPITPSDHMPVMVELLYEGFSED